VRGLEQLTDLKTLNLSDNGIMTVDGIQALNANRKLTTLDLSGNPITMYGLVASCF